MISSEPNIYKIKIGDFNLTLLSNGLTTGSPLILINLTDKIIEETIPEKSFSMATNAFLLQTPTKNILIDTAYQANLFTNLELLNIKPSEINEIFLTHTHRDHIDGLLIGMERSFPNASIFLSWPEFEFGINNTFVSVYGERVNAFNLSASDVFPRGVGVVVSDEIRAFAAFGHTPGHTVYLIESKGEKVLIWGDLVHALQVQIPYPAIAVTYDNDPFSAIKSRVEIFEYISENTILAAGMHIAYPAIGQVSLRNFKFEFTFYPNIYPPLFIQPENLSQIFSETDTKPSSQNSFSNKYFHTFSFSFSESNSYSF